MHLLHPRGSSKQSRQFSMQVIQVLVVESNNFPFSHSVQDVRLPEQRVHGAVHAVHEPSGLLIPLLVILSQTQLPAKEGVSTKGALQL